MTVYPEFIQSTKKRLDTTLPGKRAQFDMAAIGRPAYNAVPREDVRTASVLISLFDTPKGWSTLVIKRRAVKGDRHSGQISFPGGKRENGEPLSFTAVRESYEEVGTPIDGIDILGRLTELHIPVSNFIVHPFVGYLKNLSPLIRQEEEVDAIYEIRLADLFDPSARKRKDIRVPEGFLLRDVPYYDIAGQVIWGATAMIISEFEAVIKDMSLVTADH